MAPATPAGRSAIGIIRLSGPRAIEIAQRLWHPLGKSSRIQPRQLYLGEICEPENSTALDQAMCVIMPGPRSFTGEDVAEFHCHGGVYLIRKVVGLALSEGARIAEPGEFTRRAFLNGRIDLTEAEAIADLIDARGTTALQQSLAQLAGALSARLKLLRRQVIDIRAHLEAAIDFSEEEIDLPSRDSIATDTSTLIENISVLYQSFSKGRVIREGARAAILGKPNVGKSSILNLLLGIERAIVTAVPGTTRDLIEELVDLGEYSVVLTDTAGIRDSQDEVEQIGISRARASAQNADLLIAVFDSSRSLETDDVAVIKIAHGRKGVALLNKRDLPQRTDPDALRGFGLSLPIIDFCAVNGDGLDHCRQILVEQIEEMTGSELRDNIVISRERHRNALARTLDALKSGLHGLRNRMPPEIVAIDLATAAASLGSITGEISSEDILDAIFREFCIGK
ncbi:MAG TPA: tRNA uridine-5-carboxymethylaminomethyl(34) synthesis GTPase MnmE [Candidatus Binataceae bacterium]|nr:tRNA uridine-5-carboxymethylaminomethyl(34) synthesis GTPase MnmE [Candidatus Binataceae bacterium]